MGSLQFDGTVQSTRVISVIRAFWFLSIRMRKQATKHEFGVQRFEFESAFTQTQTPSILLSLSIRLEMQLFRNLFVLLAFCDIDDRTRNRRPPKPLIFVTLIFVEWKVPCCTCGTRMCSRVCSGVIFFNGRARERGACASAAYSRRYSEITAR